jgi:hypothetical protein
MAEVNLWEPNHGHIGYCSLALNDGSYVSFWQCREYSKSEVLNNETVPSTSSTYENDRLLQRDKDPETFIRLSGRLNNQAIHTWWMQNMACGFSIRSNNCTTMVENALEVGGLESDEYNNNFPISFS